MASAWHATVVTFLLLAFQHASAQGDVTGGCIVLMAGGGSGNDGGLATLASLRLPTGVANMYDGTGSFTVMDRANNAIRLVSGTTGIISRLAGTGTAAYSGDGGAAVNATLSSPAAAAVDPTNGALYFVESNNVVRRILGGIITTVVGNGTRAWNGDGPALSTTLNNPFGISMDVAAARSLLISDTGNHVIRRFFIANSSIVTVAGTGTVAGFTGDGGPAIRAQLNSPRAVALAVDAIGGFFIADGTNARVRRVSASGIITTIGGNGTSGYSGDGASALLAMLNGPFGVAADAGGVLVADSAGHRIRRINLVSGIISTLIGTGTGGVTGSGGPLSSAQVSNPQGFDADGSGGWYIIELSGSVVRRLLPPSQCAATGVLTGCFNASATTISCVLRNLAPLTLSATLAGAACNVVLGPYASGNGTALVSCPTPSSSMVTSANFTWSNGLGGGTVALPFTTTGLVPSASPAPSASSTPSPSPSSSAPAPGSVFPSSFCISTLAGTGAAGNGANGPAIAVQLNQPYGVVSDGANGFLITDRSNHVVRRLLPSGTLVAAAGTAGTVGFSGDGGSATSGRLNLPSSTASEGAGVFLIADAGNHVVRRVTNGIITTVAGTGVAGMSGDGGAATAAQLNSPTSVVFDGAGGFYIADNNNNVIRRVSSSGMMSRVAGSAQSGYSGDGGAATSARISAYTVALDGAGGFVFTDVFSHVIRRVSGSGVVSTVLGNGTFGFTPDGFPATSTRLNSPYGVTADGFGGFVMADSSNSIIRRVFNGVVTTIAGAAARSGYAGDGQSSLSPSTRLNVPLSLAPDGAFGFVFADFAANVVRRLTPSWYCGMQGTFSVCSNATATTASCTIINLPPVTWINATLSWSGGMSACNFTMQPSVSSAVVNCTVPLISTIATLAWTLPTGASNSASISLPLAAPTASSTPTASASATSSITSSSTQTSSATAPPSSSASSAATTSATASNAPSSATATTSVAVRFTGSATMTSSIFATITASSSSTVTASISTTSSMTGSSTPTSSLTSTGSATWSTGASSSMSSSRSVTSSATASSSSSGTSSATMTASATGSSSSTWSSGSSPSVTSTSSLTGSSTPTSSMSSSSTRSSTATSSFSSTSSATGSSSSTWSAGASASSSSTATLTSSATASSILSASGTSSSTGTQSASSTSTGSSTPTSSLSATGSSTWSTGASPSVTSTSSVTSSSTSTLTLTSSATASTSAQASSAASMQAGNATASTSASTPATASSTAGSSVQLGSASPSASFGRANSSSTPSSASASATGSVAASRTQSPFVAVSVSSASSPLATASVLVSAAASVSVSASPSQSPPTRYYPNVRLTLNVFAFIPQGAPALTLPGTAVDLRSTIGALCALRLTVATLMGIPVADVRLAVSGSSSVTVLTNDCTSMGAALAANASRTLSDAASLRGLATSACGGATTGVVGSCSVAPALPSPPPTATSTAPLTSMQVIVMIPASNSSLLTSTSLCSSLALSSGDPDTTPASGGALSSLRSVAGVTMMLSIPSGQSVAGCASNVISDLVLLDPAQAPVTTAAPAASSTGGTTAVQAAVIGGAATAGVVVVVLIIAGVAYACTRTRNAEEQKVLSANTVVAGAAYVTKHRASMTASGPGAEAKDASTSADSSAFVNPLLQAQAAASQYERTQVQRGASQYGVQSPDSSAGVASPAQRAGFAPQQRKRGGADTNSMRAVLAVPV